MLETYLLFPGQYLKDATKFQTVGGKQCYELVHHLVQLVTFENFQWPFSILVQQVFRKKGFTCNQHNGQHSSPYDVQGTSSSTKDLT
jgi:hypothetical protein